MTVVTVQQDFARNTWGQPLITPDGGGKPLAYRRCTRYVSVLEDLWNLQQWEKRMVALGLVERADLRLSISAHSDDKKKLNALCDQAKEHAKASAAATTGTALHTLTDIVDSGGKLPHLDPGPAASIAAFREATEPLKVIDIERKLVLDTHKVAGTADRIYEFNGQRYIGDTKSGNIELGILKICMQLAVYARSETYDVATGERGIHGCSTTRALVMHMPATDDPAQARCEIVWVDIESGWEAVKVAKQVWAQRALKYPQLARPFNPHETPMPSLRIEMRDEQRKADDRAHRIAALESQIKACPDYQTVHDLWEANEAEWTPHLTEVAKAHVAQLPTSA